MRRNHPLLALSIHTRRVVGFASTASTASTSGTNRLNSVEVVGYWVEATTSPVEAISPTGVLVRPREYTSRQ